MPVGMPVTKQSIVDEFNARVVALTVGRGAAQWHQATAPFTSTPPAALLGHLGPQAEPGNKNAADITVNNLTPNNIFNILHGWAMELTRVRRVTAVFYSTSINNSPRWIIQSQNLGTRPTAMSDHYMRYFPIPGDQMDAGTQVNLADFQKFLDDLRTQVNVIRGSSVTLQGCHSSCHSNCHGSRGRR